MYCLSIGLILLYVTILFILLQTLLVMSLKGKRNYFFFQFHVALCYDITGYDMVLLVYHRCVILLPLPLPPLFWIRGVHYHMLIYRYSYFYWN